MKSFKLLLAVTVLLTLASSCDDRPVNPAELPQPIIQFVNQHFPNKTIVGADKDLEIFGYQYDVFLNDGTEINFDTDYVWDKVDTKLNPVPVTLIPDPIRTHIETNFPNTPIVKIDKERYGYDIELINDMELKFSYQGALMGFDD